MPNKLKCVIVDDSELILESVSDFCNELNLVDVVASFASPKKFLDASPSLRYDLCLLDICMPEIDGIEVAKMIKNKPVIFMTAHDERLKYALKENHIAVLSKPFTEQILSNAIMKANLFIKGVSESSGKEYAAFNIAESKEKLMIRLTDILYVKSDIDCRNKEILMKDGEHYTIMGCNFEKLTKMSSALIQINKSEMVSIEAIKTFKYDTVTLKNIGGKALHLTLSNAYRKGFKERMVNKKY